MREYDNRKAEVSTIGSIGLRAPETLAERLDRNIAETEAHLNSMKEARKLIQDNPILQQFHDALRKVGF